MRVKDGAKTAGLGVGVWVVIVLVVLIVTATSVYVFGGFQRLTAAFRGDTERIEKTTGDGDYQIAQYDKFFNDCSAIQALEDQVKTMTANKSLPKDQVDINILALTNQRNILIRTYNTNARKANTAGQFRASDLPYQINPTLGDTVC